MKKAILVLITVIMGLMSLIGCSDDKYYSSKNDNVLPKEKYAKYEEDMQEIYSWGDDGIISGEYDFSRGMQDGSTAIFKGRGVKIWGTETLLDFEIKEETEITLSREEKLKSGECKLVICDENGVVSYIGENQKEEIKLASGKYKVKVVGQPAEFTKLAINLVGVKLDIVVDELDE